MKNANFITPPSMSAIRRERRFLLFRLAAAAAVINHFPMPLSFAHQ
jgi:hypothetical protein